VNLSERVRQAMLRPDLCHREPEFAGLQNGIREKLLQVYDLDPQRWAAVLLTGSGTAAVEAMVSTLVPETGKLAIIENGVYGERITKIAEIYHIPHVRLTHHWTEPIDLDALEACLKTEPGITHLAVIHHETTTGRLNSLGAVAELCKGRGIQLLVDGVSSFGAERIDFEDWGIAGCAATANKCLHGVPGTSFAIVRRDALPPEDAPRRNLYLDLSAYCRNQDQGDTPFTQSVQTFYALDEALDELAEEGGWTERHRLYRQRMAIVREGFEGFGIQPLLAREECSVVLNAFRLPAGLSYTALHDHLKENGFVIYAGQGDFAKTLFRISTMGVIGTEDLQQLVQVVGRQIN
jgi:2-aminoethylphosphonate-pyruvate transaminase